MHSASSALCGAPHKAEFERELIRTRTGEGRARAKVAGKSLGRKPKLTPHQKQEAIGRRDQGEAVREIARTYNVQSEHDFPANGLMWKPQHRLEGV